MNVTANGLAKYTIEAFRRVHGDRYTYDNYVYGGSEKLAVFTCPVHGDFQQRPYSHLQGQGCPKCAPSKLSRKLSKSQDEVLEGFHKVHGDRYDYSSVLYTNSKTPVVIICREHGSFAQSPHAHLSGQGCPECGKLSSVRARTYTQEEVLSKCTEVHMGRYDYSQTIYSGSMQKMDIICPEHGVFSQTASHHLKGHGCPKCADERNGAMTRKSLPKVIEEFRTVHGDKYEYSKVVYIHANEKVEIICPKHGTFLQRAADHQRGAGCPRCATVISEPHRAIIDMLSGEEVVINDRELISPLEIDVYLPKYALGVEINGLHFHSERFQPDRTAHEYKRKAAEGKGIQLLQFWDKDIKERPALVESMLMSKLGRLYDKVHARKCTVVPLPLGLYNAFMEANHIQGVGATSSLRYGLVYEDYVVAAMGLTRRSGTWFLDRFATKTFMTVPGGFSRLLAHFSAEHAPTSVVTYSDGMYSTGNVYAVNGFKKTGESSTLRMHFTDGSTLVNRRNFQKGIVKKRHPEVYDPSLTEAEMAYRLGFSRVWGCSTTRWEKRFL